MNNSEVFDAGPYMVRGHKQRCLSAVEPDVPSELEIQEHQEEQDMFLGVPMRRYGPSRRSVHVRDSFRRHSWEPGKRTQEEQANYDSLSLKGLDAEEMEENMGYNRDPRRTPIIRSTDELESLLSLRGEDMEVTQEEHAKRLQEYLSQVYCYSPLSKSVSMTGIDDVVLYSHRNHLGNGLSAVSCGEFDVLEADEKENRNKEESRFERTLSFIKKFSGGKSKNKDKEKMKEREKDAKDTRYTNGHLFTTITVSGTTMCFVCSKSITAKEALICPTCSVTIHNRCKDSLPSCTKVKQKQQKAAFLKNSSALQNVSLRNKSTTLRERPNSAIYPSDSLRHSLLGSRRGRPSLSLSKSVSTTNIAGNLNDESPLGIRRILSQSTDSLNMRNRTLSVESLIDEGGADVICSQLMSDFATDEKEFEADSWSTAVDNNYLQQHKKDVMKRQDVIYELIQTEVHHVRTLKIMTNLFRKGMLEDLQMDPALAQKMFPCVDELSDIHIRFLIQLLERRKDSLASDSNKNFVINKLGDILINQFSGTNAEHMKKAYTEFCSQHQKAVKLYKELFSRDKKFQQLIRKLTRSQLLRRHGVPECILLVTQRITKYPVLIDRILQNSKGDEEEHQDLASSLTLVKDLLSSIDLEVYNNEKNLRLQEIYQKVDSKSTALVQGNYCFSKEELLRRKLVHEGSLLWKTVAGRFKDVIMLLMTDVLVLLQEKDQKFYFPTLDRSPIISLQNLIVRDIANQEKGMFLISAKPPEMYEVHAASREDRNTWMKLIAQSVKVCPKREDFPLIETEVEAKLRKLKEVIQQRDREVADILEEKVTLFTKVLQLQTGEDVPVGGNTRKLFRTESTDSYRGEKLITEAIKEVEALKDVIFSIGTEQLSLKMDHNHVSSTTSYTAYTETSSVNGSLDSNKDEDQKDRNGNQLQNKSPQEEALQRISSLYNLLHGLQVVVTQQDSLLSLQIQDGSEKKESLSRANSRDLTVAEPLSKSIDKPGTELTLLQRQHTLLQEELRRSRRQCEERAQEAGTLETRLRESEQARTKLEREMEEAKRQLAQVHRERSNSGIEIVRVSRPSDPRRRSLPAGDALYQTFTPPQSNNDRRSTMADGPLPIITFQDDSDLKDDLSDLTELERLPETADTESSEEEGGGPPTSPSSAREFLRMQDIPEEAESIQDLRDAEIGSSES
ncbi:rho guanine nucleotide exchange factor 2 isoform X1 [Bufo gargarizans]|uniref:rho guanine nucleotide exchange factor 2 isoform X1 n=1 Tax=Bufo gargarizans TaxID=30331 RepID=UPI001CF28805|nr:rho guanine nucleotide exchange factor 2 isoform X1 [Bufo gargarizans]XP_044130213.1 rho guanine nucleotide exchange factor 2 isoform X1 [Bufo gargarizans]XP_044130214.1 rho guanine nucleotide exchange factor 2 isoform X1 [Bufo gargarizans]